MEKHNKKRLYNALFYLNAAGCVFDVALFVFLVPHQFLYLLCAGLFAFGAYVNSSRLKETKEPSPEEKQKKRREEWLKLVGKEEKKDE